MGGTTVYALGENDNINIFNLKISFEEFVSLIEPLIKNKKIKEKFSLEKVKDVFPLTISSEKEGTSLPPSVKIVKDYTRESHVLVGDFKNKYENFRVEYLRKADFAHYNSKLLTGPGWTICKKNIHDVISALEKYNINFEEEIFDQNKRKEHNRLQNKRRYQKKKIDKIRKISAE